MHLILSCKKISQAKLLQFKDRPYTGAGLCCGVSFTVLENGGRIPVVFAVENTHH